MRLAQHEPLAAHLQPVYVILLHLPIQLHPMLGVFPCWVYSSQRDGNLNSPHSEQQQQQLAFQLLSERIGPHSPPSAAEGIRLLAIRMQVWRERQGQVAEGSGFKL